jgi:hypothetical protein
VAAASGEKPHRWFILVREHMSAGMAENGVLSPSTKPVLGTEFEVCGRSGPRFQ